MQSNRLLWGSKKSLYWLGFIYADGNIYGDRLSMSLNRKDRNHLIKLANFLGAKYRETDYIHLSQRGQDRRGLKKFGIVPRKSTDFVCPRLTDDEFKLFSIGCIDGDGNITLTKRKYKNRIYSYPIIQLSGNLYFLVWVQQRMFRLGIEAGLYSPQKKPNLQIWDKTSLEIIYSWKNCLPFGLVLDRKWEILDSHFANISE